MRLEPKVIVAATVLLIILGTSCSQEKPVSHPGEMPPTPFPTYTPIPIVIEPGLAFGRPCKPPCWRGLIPGQSTSQEVSQAIEQVQVEDWAFQISGSPDNGYVIYPLPATMRGSIHIEVNNGTVNVIAGGILFDYSLSTMIEQFGSPVAVPSSNSLSGLFRGDTCTSCDMWESTKDMGSTGLIPLLYPEQGLLFWAWNSPSGKGCVCPKMQIDGFCYFEPRSMAEALQDGYLANLCYLAALEKLTEEDLVEWHGFGGGY